MKHMWRSYSIRCLMLPRSNNVHVVQKFHTRYPGRDIVVHLFFVPESSFLRVLDPVIQGGVP